MAPPTGQVLSSGIHGLCNRVFVTQLLECFGQLFYPHHQRSLPSNTTTLVLRKRMIRLPLHKDARADGEGFEPPVGFHPQRFSRPPP